MTDAPVAPNPAAPASSTPAAPPAAPAGDRAPESYLSDIASDLAGMDDGKPVGQPATGTPPPAKPDGAKPPAQDKPPVAPDGGTKPPEIPGDGKPVKAAELRGAYEGLKKRVKEELEPEVQRLRAKVQEFEAKPKDDAGPLNEKIKQIEARNAELEQAIAFVDFTKSSEFSTKYETPYREAWDAAVTDFRQLRVREQAGEDESGEQVFNHRPATEQDLLRLANMDLSDMDAAAHELFGPSASRAILHIENLKRLANAKQKAIEDARTKAGDWKKQQSAAEEAKSRALAGTWTEINKTLEAKFPKAFQADAADAEDKASHLKGFALADLLFVGPEGLSPEQVEALPKSFQEIVKSKKPLSDSQRVHLHALARLKMANHDRKAAALVKAQARIAELEKSLAEYEKSAPSAARAGKSGDGQPTGDWMSEVAGELAALDK